MEEPSNKIVSAVIVTCGKKDYFQSCLNSLRNQTYPVFEIIAIDNSLKPHFSQEIKECYPEIKLYSSSNNLFYCEALNKGIKMSKGDFILCLNDDVVLEKRFIVEALKGFSANERIGIVSGKILRSDGETIDSAGLFLTSWRSAKERGYGTKDKGQYEKEGHIFGVNGAVAFYLRRMLEEIKIGQDYFDTDYHIFYEDLDIAWRGQQCGWWGYYTSKAVAYHARGGTVRRSGGINKPYARRYLSDDLHLDLIKNRYLTLIKNESAIGFLLRLPFILAYDIFVWVYVLFFRPKLIKKFILNLNYIKSAFRKRKLIHKLRFAVGENDSAGSVQNQKVLDKGNML